jgi:hypothetical protein
MAAALTSVSEHNPGADPKAKIYSGGSDGRNVKSMQDQAKVKPWCAPWCTFAFWLFLDQSRVMKFT